jgi:DNA-binding CsgD family transcriptional regulator
MPRLSRAQELARQQIARLANSGLSPGQLGERLLAAIALAVPFDGAQACAVDPATLLFNRLLAVSPGMRPHTHWYLRNLYLNDPVVDITHPGLMRARLTAVALHDRPETSWGLPGHLTSRLSAAEWNRAYHERTGAAGGILRAVFPAGGQWIAAFDMVRFEAQHPFRPTDVAFLRTVAPLIGQTLRTALDRERAMRTATTTAIDACGVLMLASNGHVQSSTPAAERWLHVLQDAGGSQEHHLPAAIWSAVAGLRAGGHRGMHAHVHVPTPGGQLRVEASPADDEGAVAVVLVPRVQPLPPALPACWQLTRQERQIVEQVLRGRSNRQIAATLVVAEDTVESHLRHVYAKLDVHSRSQLFARYFAEVYDPDLF